MANPDKDLSGAVQYCSQLPSDQVLPAHYCNDGTTAITHVYRRNVLLYSQ